MEFFKRFDRWITRFTVYTNNVLANKFNFMLGDDLIVIGFIESDLTQMFLP